MGLTSCEWITTAGTLAHRRRAVGNRLHADRRVAVERAVDRYTLICSEPLIEYVFGLVMTVLDGGDSDTSGG